MEKKGYFMALVNENDRRVGFPLLKFPVGNGGVNALSDVQIVAYLLNVATGSRLSEAGIADSNLMKAILDFQKLVGVTASGVLKPGDIGLKYLKNRAAKCVHAFQEIDNKPHLVGPGWTGPDKESVRQLLAWIGGEKQSYSTAPHRAYVNEILRRTHVPSIRVAGQEVAGFFPLDRTNYRGDSWLESPRSFGSNRSNGTRAHAGCDIYAKKEGTLVCAVRNGRVLTKKQFYLGSHQVTIEHDLFVAVYGELLPDVSGKYPKVGDMVEAGQVIGEVKDLGLTGYPPMLHFEMYENTSANTVQGVTFLDTSSASKKRADGVPYQRKNTLLNPEVYLNEWVKNCLNLSE
jgi:murein DD-endopeptidase MepM/ murein hydrolase activator NlpD